jgi:hypothetical protein
MNRFPQFLAAVFFIPFLLLCCMSATPTHPMSLSACLSTYDLRFQIQQTLVDSTIADPETAIVAAVKEQSAAADLPDLPAHLNPYRLDAAKVRAFLAYFPQLPPAQLQAFTHRTIGLEDENLLLSGSDPVTPEQFRAGYGLFLAEIIADSILIFRLEMERDATMAENLAIEAKAAVAQATREIEVLDAKKAQLSASAVPELQALLHDRGYLFARRSAATVSWLKNIRFLAERFPQEARYPSEVAAAETAFQQYFQAPSLGGMPGQ